MRFPAPSSLRPVFVCILLALPLGYAPDMEELAPGSLRVASGRGQVYGLVPPGCDEDEFSAGHSEFNEASVDLSWNVKSVEGEILRVGVRAAMWEAPDTRSLRIASAEDGPDRGSFANPYFDVEFRRVGFGLGIAIGRMALSFDDVLESDFRSSFVTGHFRLGAPRTPQLLITWGELQPVSVAGWVNAGLAYSIGPARLYSAWSAGWYDGAGAMQAISVPVGQHFALDVIGRYGSSSPGDEWGLAVGATMRFGR